MLEDLLKPTINVTSEPVKASKWQPLLFSKNGDTRAARVFFDTEKECLARIKSRDARVKGKSPNSWVCVNGMRFCRVKDFLWGIPMPVKP